MTLEDPAVLIGSLTVVIGAFSLLNSLLVARIERRISRRARAADLYNEYYSPENYRRIVLPVIRLALKWRGLPDAEREAYRAAVRRGWLGFETEPARLLEAYVSAENLHEDADRAHFRDALPAEAFTEHEALTAFLYFWTKVHELLRSGIIERATTRRLLGRPYRYAANFLKELRADIEEHLGDRDAPVWVEATRKLDKVLA